MYIGVISLKQKELLFTFEQVKYELQFFSEITANNSKEIQDLSLFPTASNYTLL